MGEDWHTVTALELGAYIEDGRVDPVTLVEYFLDRIEHHDSDRSVFLHPMPNRGRLEAVAAKDRAKRGLRRGPLDGVPISWKDLFDTAGTPTTAASTLLKNRVPLDDALVVRRAASGGAVCLGKTNLTEFAYSGLGINPVTGTPENPFDKDTARCPGGSSSGAAVSVSTGLASAAIGSDTGGSVRVPAAWNNLVGLKTTIGLVPTDGVLPLSQTLDTVGPLTKNVADANAVLGLLLNDRPANLDGANLSGTRLLVASAFLSDGMSKSVQQIFESAIDVIGKAGASLVFGDVPEYQELDRLIGSPGDIQACEAYANWGELVSANVQSVYRPVAERILAGREYLAVDMIKHSMKVLELQHRYFKRAAEFSAVLTPTVMISPPPIAMLADDDDRYVTANIESLRFSRLGNRLGLCGLTIPCGFDTLGMPVGLLINGLPKTDYGILRIGAAIERALESTQ